MALASSEESPDPRDRHRVEDGPKEHPTMWSRFHTAADEIRYSRLLRQTASTAKLDIEGSKTVTTAKGTRA